ncbi:MAG: hypothetical protein ACKO34_06595 [Vampirovibrionales bacterium]
MMMTSFYRKASNEQYYHTLSLFELDGGINQLANRLDIATKQQQRIENLHWNPRQGWSTENVGYSLLTSTPLASGATLRRVYPFMDAQNVSHLMVQAGSTLLDVDALTGNIVRNLGTVGAAPCGFATLNGVCIITSTQFAPRTYDGSNPLQALASWPPYFPELNVGSPSIACFYGNRLCVAGDANNPSLLLLSHEERMNDFVQYANDVQSGGGVLVAPGDGDKITALVPLFVPYTNEQQLIIFKERSIYTLRGHNWETFQLEQLTQHVGAINAQSVLQAGGELWFLSLQGVNSLSANTALGVLAVGNVSLPIQASVQQLNRYALSTAFAFYDTVRQEAWWCVPTNSHPRPNRVWVQKRMPNGHSIWSERTQLELTCGCALFTGELITGNHLGQLHRQRQGLSYAGQAISWVWQSSPLLTSKHGLQARFRHVDVLVRQIGSQSFNLSLSYNLGQRAGETLVPSIVVSGDEAKAAYGGASYGSTQRYGELTAAMARCFPAGSASWVELTCSGVLSGTTPITNFPLHQPFALEGLQLSFIEGGTQQ